MLQTKLKIGTQIRQLSHIWKCMSTAIPHVKPDEKKQQFLSVFPEILKSLTSDLQSNIPTFSKHYAEALTYNVLKEKRFRPFIVLDAYKTLELSEKLTNEKIHLSNVLAWCIELLHTSIIINDDVMDRSQTRGNEIAWYMKENVGLNALTDAVLVVEGAFVLLKKYFSTEDTYLPLSDLFRYINMSSAVGQSLDWKCKQNGKPVYELFNTNFYKTTIRYKGCAPFVEGPFLSALILSNNSNRKVLNEITDTVMKLGEAFQIDNDVLDVFDNGKVRKEIGSDIREGKCTWLAVQVLEHGNNDLRRIFKENYGRQGFEHENQVINVYSKMDLFHKYLAYKEQTLNIINEGLKRMTKPSLREAVLNLTANIFP